MINYKYTWLLTKANVIPNSAVTFVMMSSLRLSCNQGI